MLGNRPGAVPPPAAARPAGPVPVSDESLLLRETGAALIYPPTAVFDPLKVYRYELTRTWSAAPPWAWCMRNPSTADALRDDQTVTRCCRFARAGGAGGIVAVNLFAWRATDPAELARQPDPVGELNDAFILQACTAPGRVVVAAWGCHGTLCGRDAAVTRMLATEGVRLMCLGTTKGGQPLHPSRLPAAAQLIPYEPRASATA
jgi:hypothetical protein